MDDKKNVEQHPAKSFEGDIVKFPQPKTLIETSRLLSDVSSQLSANCFLPEGAADAIALWILFSWCHDVFETSPRLALQSPVPGCGKTTVLGIVAALVPSPLPTSNISAAAIYRILKRGQRTLLLDEIDTVIDTSPDLLNVLNSGHVRTTARVVRCDGKGEYIAREFSTWAACLLAGIGGLPAALQSRAIVIWMQRAPPSAKTGEVAHEPLRILKEQLSVWSKLSATTLKNARPTLPRGFHGRLADNWRPLIAIADLAGGDWSARGRAAAEVLTGDLETPTELKFLETACRAVRELGTDRLSSKRLHDALKRHSNDDDDVPIGSLKSMASRLRAFGIRPTVMRIEGKPVRGYSSLDFCQAAETYQLDRNRQEIQ